jgi:uncharacterized OB-fold protein
MRECPHCGKGNEPHRKVCVDCLKPMEGDSEEDRARREAIARVVAAAPPPTARQIAALRRIFSNAPSRQHAA